MRSCERCRGEGAADEGVVELVVGGGLEALGETHGCGCGDPVYGVVVVVAT